jgi:salicylate 5-hydroxylase small subunit
VITDIDLDRQIDNLMANYASCLDKGTYEAWPDFFAPEAWYKIMPRENHDAGLTLSTLALHGQGMMRDRIYGVQSTIFHAPYYQRHILGPTRVTGREGNLVMTETNYLVVRTKRDVPPDILSVGVYLDRIERHDDGLRFAEKLCIFDNDLIPNSLIYPI